MNKKLRVASGRVLAAAFCVLVCLSVSATVYTVNNTTDGNGTNQLRGALVAANASAGPHTIIVAAGTYNLTLGTITFGSIAQNITITGAGPALTVINMTTTNQDRIFLINPPGTVANIQTTISGIRFTNGRLTSDVYGGGAIICGGLNNSMTITNCEFVNNSTNASAAGGGALAFLPGGTLNIDQCLFTGNATNAAGTAGGAIFFNPYSYTNPGYIYPSTSFTLTNTTFSGNSSGTNGSGGAIAMAIQGYSTSNPPFPTLSVNVTQNNFIGNSAPGATGVGGAISVTNSFSTTNTVNINYNRFVNNTSGSGNGSALVMYDNQGNVNATNNWWGCNSGPASCADKAFRFSGSSPGVLTTMPYLQLRSSAASTTLCSGTATTITAGFTVNSAGTNIAASNLGAFTGVPISFSAALGTISGAQTTIQSTGTATATYTAGNTAGAGTINTVVDNIPPNDAIARASVTVNSVPTVTNPANAVACAGTAVSFNVTGGGSGTLSYQWFKGTTMLNNGATGTGSTISGATTATLTITNPGTSDAATNYNVKVSSTTGCSVTSANASLTVNSLPAITTSPGNTVTCAGITASFTAAASGNGTLSYQWYKAANTTIVNNGVTGTGSTISGATTATLTITNPGTADATTYNVRVSSSTGCSPATSASATLTVNTLAITSQPTSITSGACTGNPVSFTAAGSGSGTLSYQWYKGVTALADGATGTGSVISGATTATLTINNPSVADNAANYNVRVSSTTGCTPAQSNNATLTVAAPATATATTNGSKIISSTNTIISDASCNLIATVLPSGTSPVSANVSATVTVQGSVPTTSGGTPYLQRHYDIVPSLNAATATATLTLYFTQAEFTALNTFTGPNPTPLPINSTDAANNKANIRIFQYHGTGTAPGNYTGTSQTIDPADNNIIYNTTYARWEITFPITGFSGFYLSYVGSQILPLQLTSFTSFTDGISAWLQWKTAAEINVNYFEIERSTDAVHFTKAGQLAAGNSNYSFTDKPDVKTVYYYRLKIVDKDGKTSYSYTVAINLNKAVLAVQVLPNPFTDKIMLSITSPQSSKADIRLTDVSGKILLRKTILLQTGINAVTLNEVSAISKGIYFLQVTNEKMNETIKVIKAD